MISLPSPITSSFNPSIHGGGPNARELAIALARLESERYQRILPIEYVAHVGKLSHYCPNLSAAIALNQMITGWVQSSILDLDFVGDPNGLQKRSEVKRFFVKTAKVVSTRSI
jgi:RasGEF domain